MNTAEQRFVEQVENLERLSGRKLERPITPAALEELITIASDFIVKIEERNALRRELETLVEVQEDQKKAVALYSQIKADLARERQLAKSSAAAETHSLLAASINRTQI